MHEDPVAAVQWKAKLRQLLAELRKWWRGSSSN